MSLAIVHSRALDGLRTLPVTVEVHLANGLPSFTLVGLADTEVKEARERVRAALQNSALTFPHNKRITVNLAPADLPKESGRFDLPIALGLLAASGQIDSEQLERWEFAGELSLAGELRPIRGALAMALALKKEHSPRALVIPEANGQEAALVDGLALFEAKHLLDLVQVFTSASPTSLPAVLRPISRHTSEVVKASVKHLDLSDVKGQASAKRALEIAASGGHSLLMVGPPGTGKSMLAQRLATILPLQSEQEALETAAILSLNGQFDHTQWRRRIFRAPHHTASPIAIVGGGSPPRPGEISLAHYGVLFLDELPEFSRATLEALREPLERGSITISRAARQAEFPAKFQLIAAMNPCPCGYFGSTQQLCRCNPEAILRYQNKLSGPLLDRIDLQVEVPTLSAEVLSGLPQGESSEQVSMRVARARDCQLQRQGMLNAELPGKRLEEVALLEPATLAFMQTSATRLGWSGRSYYCILRLARTVADLAQEAAISTAHIAEAIQYRRALAQP